MATSHPKPDQWKKEKQKQKQNKKKAHRQNNETVGSLIKNDNSQAVHLRGFRVKKRGGASG